MYKCSGQLVALHIITHTEKHRKIHGADFCPLIFEQAVARLTVSVAFDVLRLQTKLYAVIILYACKH